MNVYRQWLTRATKLPITAEKLSWNGWFYDDTENIDYLNNFVSKIKSANVKKLSCMQIRKAILKGLSKKSKNTIN